MSCSDNKNLPQDLRLSSEDKHTPGPWRYEADTLGYEIVSSSPEMSATVAFITARPSITGAADARLIAAAPELLAALKDASRTLKGCISACVQKRAIGVQSRPCLVCRIEAAIAKVEAQ